MPNYQVQLKDKHGNKQFPVTYAGAVMTESGDNLETVLKNLEEGKCYIHNQGEAASVWTIHHDLNAYPSVTVVDSAGSEVYGDVFYVNKTDITVTFSAPFSGKAYLN